MDSPRGQTMGHLDLSFLKEQLRGCSITANDAVKLAERWWDTTGRGAMLKARKANIEVNTKFRPAANGAPGIKTVSREVVLPSRILEGQLWAELDKRERYSVVVAWLKFYRANFPRDQSSVRQ